MSSRVQFSTYLFARKRTIIHSQAQDSRLVDPARAGVLKAYLQVMQCQCPRSSPGSWTPVLRQVRGLQQLAMAIGETHRKKLAIGRELEDVGDQFLEDLHQVQGSCVVVPGWWRCWSWFMLIPFKIPRVSAENPSKNEGKDSSEGWFDLRWTTVASPART